MLFSAHDAKKEEDEENVSRLYRTGRNSLLIYSRAGRLDRSSQADKPEVN